MLEKKLKQKDLAELLETSTSRISEYLNGKRDITIEIARAWHKKLYIDSDIIILFNTILGGQYPPINQRYPNER